jgi:membrane protein DedA with SNARE-associated domain
LFALTPPSGTPALPGFLDALAPILNQWGYLAVGALIMLEDFGIPVPGETVLIAAAVYAGAGQLNIFAVIAIAIVAAVVGDSIGYAIGRFGGRRLVLRYGKYVFINPERLDKAERFFQRHGGKIITIARFIEGLRQANGIIAGITQMRWIRFFAFNLLGAVLWVCTWAGLGYLAGSHITQIWNTIERYQPIVYTVLGIMVLAFLTWQLLRYRRAKREKAAKAAASASSAAVSGKTEEPHALEPGGLRSDPQLPGGSDSPAGDLHRGLATSASSDEGPPSR